MKPITTAVLCVLTGSCFAQFKQVTVGTKQDNQPIYGRQLILPHPLAYYDIDTVKGELVVVATPSRIKDKDDLSFIDIQNQKLVWTIKPGTRTNNIKLARRGIIRYDGRQSSYLSKGNGITTWTKKGQLAGVDPHFNKAVDRSGNVINLEDGRKIIDAGTEHRYGINAAKHLNDNTLVIAADGLYGINTQNSKSWGYGSKTGWDYHKGQGNDIVKDGAVVVSTLAFGVIGGMAAAAATGQFGAVTIATKASSNILVENNTAYFASLENLLAVDVTTGNKKFDVPLPGAKTSSSLIESRDANIYLLNLGYVPTNQGNNLLCGHPFFASYNKNTGIQNYLDSLGPKGSVAAAGYVGDTVYVNYNNKYITATNLKTGRRIFTADIKNGGLPQVASFIDKHKTYVEEKGGTFKLLHELYPGLLFVKDNANFIYTYNANTKTTERFSRTIWEPVRIKGKTAMRNEKALAILKNGKNVAVLHLENPVVAGNNAVGISKNSVTIVNLNDLINL
ncbi:MAG: hypothetical protein K0R82_152 [Flavipsychrobacter sp.]|jgi:hypothetical protein|nr:hypothetical protein [Flavipsychrobacter sp.]